MILMRIRPVNGGLFRLTILWTVRKILTLFKAQARVASLRAVGRKA